MGNQVSNLTQENLAKLSKETESKFFINYFNYTSKEKRYSKNIQKIYYLG